MKDHAAYFDGDTASDDMLIAMLRENSGEALKVIFERFHPALFRIAFGILKEESLSKDLVQEVFIDLWSRRHTSNIRNLSHYLTRAIKFQVLKALRDGKLRADHLTLFENIRFANQTEDSINSSELEALLQSAVDSLSPRCREIFVLSRYENLSHKEIAARLNISTKTVEAQIGKALALLRQQLQKAILILPPLLLLTPNC